jgi:hypothetical protein
LISFWINCQRCACIFSDLSICRTSGLRCSVVAGFAGFDAVAGFAVAGFDSVAGVELVTVTGFASVTDLDSVGRRES